MKRLETQSLVFIPAVQEANDFVKAYHEKHGSSNSWQRQLLRAPFGVVIANNSIAGALIGQADFNDHNKDGFIYMLINSDGIFELDSDHVKTAMSVSSGQNVRKRNLSITDDDHNFLTQLGAGNASAGLRVAVEIARFARRSYYPGYPGI